MKIVILTLVLISRSSFIKVRQQEKETSTLLRQKMKNTKDKKLKMLINQLKVEDLIIYIHQFRRLTFRSLFLLRLMKPYWYRHPYINSWMELFTSVLQLLLNMGNKNNWNARLEKCPNTEFFLVRIFSYLD